MGTIWKKFRFQRVLVEIYAWFEVFFSFIPGQIGVIVRRGFYKCFLGAVGKKFTIGMFSRIQQPQAVFIGDNISFNDRAWIAANDKNGQIFIGNDTIIGPNCIIHTGNHKYSNRELPIAKQGYEFKTVKIGNGVWLGSNVVVLQSVKLSDGAILAAGSIVTKNVEAFSIFGGVPAKKIKEK